MPSPPAGLPAEPRRRLAAAFGGTCRPCARGASRIVAAVLGLALAQLALAQPTQPRPEACAAWPGEAAPLPTLDDADAVRARWAALRRDELARVAQALEGVDRLEAYRLWRHAHCLAPADAEIARALARTKPAAVHRPHVRAPLDAQSAALAPVGARSFETALQQLSVRVIAAHPPAAAPRAARPARDARPVEPRVVAETAAVEPRVVAELARAQPLRPQAQAVEPAPDRPACGTHETACGEIAALGAELDALEALVQGARFRLALARADALTPRLRALDRSPPSRGLRVRAEVLRATSQVALGNASQARDAFARALLDDPELHLDPLAVSPKVRRALEEARSGGLDG